MDNEILNKIDEKLKLILRQFYELHERVQELEKEQSSIDSAVIRYGMMILLVLTFGVVLWIIM